MIGHKVELKLSLLLALAFFYLQGGLWIDIVVSWSERLRECFPFKYSSHYNLCRPCATKKAIVEKCIVAASA